MGERGPAPKPSSLVLLEGNRSKRPLNTREPKPRQVRPKCPGVERTREIAALSDVAGRERLVFT